MQILVCIFFLISVAEKVNAKVRLLIGWLGVTVVTRKTITLSLGSSQANESMYADVRLERISIALEKGRKSSSKTPTMRGVNPRQRSQLMRWREKVDAII